MHLYLLFCYLTNSLSYSLLDKKLKKSKMVSLAAVFMCLATLACLHCMQLIVFVGLSYLVNELLSV